MVGILQNRALRKIFVSKGQEVTEGCTKFYNDGHRDFFSSPNIIR